MSDTSIYVAVFLFRVQNAPGLNSDWHEPFSDAVGISKMRSCSADVRHSVITFRRTYQSTPERTLRL
jgi:hypothetical protein